MLETRKCYMKKAEQDREKKMEEGIILFSQDQVN
jgi:hypothetical protein